MNPTGSVLAKLLLTLVLASPLPAGAIRVLDADANPSQPEMGLALRTWFEQQAILPNLKPADLYSGQQLHTLYKELGYQPLWLKATGPRPEARGLVEGIRDIRREGLDPTDYHLRTLEGLLDAPNPQARVALEVLLSDAWLTLARHLANGKVQPRRADPNWHIPPQPLDPLRLLREQLGKPLDPLAQLSELAPPQPEYRHLREALALYRGYAAAGGWPELPDGPKLSPGDQDVRLPLLRQRLRMTGELADPVSAPELTNPLFYDEDTVQAVRRFQAHHGLEEDGIVGRATRSALNVSAEARARQIELNMERWRWLPRKWEKPFILANMAGFELALMDEGQEPLVMRTIVGQRYRSTPAFTRNLTHLVLNPHWHVPSRIAREDILPELRKDPAYVQKKKLHFYTRLDGEMTKVDPTEIDWHAVSENGFPYRIRQDPGPVNALGRIKFVMPNSFDIYLHDTPKRHLFERPVRTFSSGCIRVEKPVELALRLLRGDKFWTLDRLQAAIDSRATRTLTLPRQVPVYLVYLTAWVDQAGKVQFRGDIYKRDAQLEMALFGPPPAPTATGDLANADHG